MPSFVKSRALQLADHLRIALVERRLAEPLPGLRQWSRQLGVSRETLGAALARLQREGWLAVGPRGVRLRRIWPRRRAGRRDGPRLVRYMVFGPYHPKGDHQFERMGVLVERLRPHDIELQWERCSKSHLEEIARRPAVPNELILLGSAPAELQRPFFAHRSSTLILGEVESDSPLPFVAVDQAGAVRHAAFSLLRRGFSDLTLVHPDFVTVGIRQAVSSFHAACAEWPVQPIFVQTLATAITPSSLHAAGRRLGEKRGKKSGLIVMAPVPVGMVVTALLQHGIRVPDEAEAMALFHSKEAVRLFPPPVHYPFPLEIWSQILAKAAVQFFQTGRLPLLRKLMTVEATRG